MSFGQPFNTFLSFARDIGEEGYEYLLRKPLLQLGRHGSKVREMFLGLPARQAVTIYAGVLWVIPVAMVQPYVSLYMVALGFSETELGVYQSMMNLVGLVFFFIGGYFSDTWGRKKALIFFDILSWGGYCSCLALARNKWWCLAAIFFLATNAASGPSYLSLLSEGIASKRRAFVFAVLQMANQAPFLLFFPLLGGVWVSKRGLVEANHEMYWLFAVLVAVGIGLRWKLLPDSEAYEKSALSWFHAFRDGLRQYRDALGRFFPKPAAGLFLFSKFLDEWIIFIWASYSSLYFVHFLGLKDSFLSIVTQGPAYVAFLSLFLIIPNITEKQIIKILGLDQLFGLAALLILLCLTKGNENVLLICLISAGLAAVGNALYGSVSAAVWMNIMDEKDRAKVVASSYAMIKVGIFLTGSAGAFLYGKVSPLSLVWVMIGIRLVGFILLRRVSRQLSLAGQVG